MRLCLIGDVLIRRSLAAVAAVTLVATMAQPAMSAENTASAPADPSLVQRMEREAEGTVQFSTEAATGRMGFVRTASGDLLPSADADSAKGAAAKAGAYLDKYAAAFGAPRAELQQSAVRKTLNGWTVESPRPTAASRVRRPAPRPRRRPGRPHRGQRLRRTALDLDIAPRVTKADAAARAIRMVKAAPPTRAAEERPQAVGREQRPDGLPDGYDPRRRGRVPARLGPRGDQQARCP